MGILNLMKYLMFVFNVLVFVRGICLFSMGVWVATDPDGFQSIIVSSPLLTAGAYLILFVGVALSFLGFLGCFGAIKQNRTILLLFFALVLLVFTVEVVAAALILVNKKQIKDEFLLSDLQKNYQGDNASDVFSTSWNTIMIAFSCCGISGPDDFGNCSHFQEQQPDELWPRACCTRDKPLQTGHLLDWKRCKQREPEYINSQGCFFTIARTLQKYISIPGAFGLGVLGFEMFAMFFAFCLYYNFD
ncbi:tetraspanin-18-like [Tiliqua scincoides]|uniref:tetraspanin-18-like n=1 Tax=Tiliqua scincoides TaxID=71010 RepID=UPI003462DA38